MCKTIIVALTLLINFIDTSPASSSPQDEFKKAYFLVKDGDRLIREQELKPAVEKYRRALAVLDELSNRNPGWNRQGIKKKADYCARHIWSRSPDAVGKMPGLSGQKLIVSSIDVGQGDSILIECPNGQNILIDGGKRNAGSKVVEYLKERGVSRIDLLIATHPDADHVGGLPAVINNFTVKKFMDPGKPHTSRYYEDLLLLIKDKKIFYELGRQGNEYQFGEVKMRILSPPDSLFEDTNDCSVVTEFQYGDIKILLTGDAAKEAELRMLNKKRLSRCQILKAGHHGSRHSTGDYFLLPVKPEVALISCGRDNAFGHPKREVLDRLDAVDCDFYRTDERGDIRVETDGKVYQVILEKKEPEVKKAARKRLESEKLNINVASLEQLVELPRIGPVKGQAVIDYRKEHGPFKCIEDIVRVKGIGPKTFERLEDWITIKVGKAPGPRKVASTRKKKPTKKKEVERLSSLKPTVASYRFPEITREELEKKPEEETISVDLINNDDYFKRVNQIFKEAKESIYLVMFIMHPSKKKSSKVNTLMKSLVEARKRGVRVKVILNKPITDGGFTTRANEKSYQKLVTFKS
ncbi:MAG: helix-hairpin-helix domain-containing protein [Candidatus Euphemobacter frigidus]|nr:helix-hairpin-helix domain-containing protein [Candidatus Euphemobacter frigidus]MDP8275820.1 helix-hairpin-helix domain-containing protein [Candidatus Euphemobacter frigidus]